MITTNTKLSVFLVSTGVMLGMYGSENNISTLTSRSYHIETMVEKLLKQRVIDNKRSREIEPEKITDIAHTVSEYLTENSHPRRLILAECLRRCMPNASEADNIINVIDEYLPEERSSQEAWSKKYYACIKSTRSNGIQYNSINVYHHDGTIIRTFDEPGTIIGISIDPENCFISALCYERRWFTNDDLTYVRSFDLTCPKNITATYPSGGILGRLCLDWRGQTIEKFYFSASGNLIVLYSFYINKTRFNLSCSFSDIVEQARDELQISKDGTCYSLAQSFLPPSIPLVASIVGSAFKSCLLGKRSR